MLQTFTLSQKVVFYLIVAAVLGVIGVSAYVNFVHREADLVLRETKAVAKADVLTQKNTTLTHDLNIAVDVNRELNGTIDIQKAAVRIENEVVQTKIKNDAAAVKKTRELVAALPSPSPAGVEEAARDIRSFGRITLIWDAYCHPEPENQACGVSK